MDLHQDNTDFQGFYWVLLGYEVLSRFPKRHCKCPWYNNNKIRFGLSVVMPNKCKQVEGETKVSSEPRFVFVFFVFFVFCVSLLVISYLKADQLNSLRTLMADLERERERERGTRHGARRVRLLFSRYEPTRVAVALILFASFLFSSKTTDHNVNGSLFHWQTIVETCEIVSRSFGASWVGFTGCLLGFFYRVV